ncbi:hypothetical protein HDU96_002056 [Phlyctochytrium bullatum]|nr:hypothetical protein HDU96_002056 [Phlyctochytrium bullatum]
MGLHLAFPSTSLVMKAVAGFQAATIVVLIVHRFSSNSAKQFDSFDMTWTFLLQLPATLVLLIALTRRRGTGMSDRVLLVYLVITLLCGALASFFLMIACNFRELNCSDPQTEICQRNLSTIVRTSVFWFVQVLCIHPSISFILEMWSFSPSSMIMSNHGLRL